MKKFYVKQNKSGSKYKYHVISLISYAESKIVGFIEIESIQWWLPVFGTLE
jgi:hypothetical protein